MRLVEAMTYTEVTDVLNEVIEKYSGSMIAA
jgi:hypothetical protein